MSICCGGSSSAERMGVVGDIQQNIEGMLAQGSHGDLLSKLGNTVLSVFNDGC